MWRRSSTASDGLPFISGSALASNAAPDMGARITSLANRIGSNRGRTHPSIKPMLDAAKRMAGLPLNRGARSLLEPAMSNLERA
jgi:hypothetical protein